MDVLIYLYHMLVTEISKGQAITISVAMTFQRSLQYDTDIMNYNEQRWLS